MALSTQPYKGARDFYPEDKRFQKYLFGIMRSVVEKYGYQEYDAPILEPLELFAAKTGEEIVNEQTYTFEDRGGRKVAIRPEMTPSVSRMVAGQRQELPYPVRWYSIPNLWRYERPQRGRLREHWQLNVDVFGLAGLEAEHEVICLADNIMQAYGAKRTMYTLRLNSRKLMDRLLHDYLGLSKGQSHILSKLVDRMHKMDYAKFVSETELAFSSEERDSGKHQQFLDVLKTESLDDLPDDLKTDESVTTLQQLMEWLAASGISNAVFDITLMRGFDYYTDIVFEVFDNHPENNRSMFGGGRYDGLVGLFGVEPVPTVGFGMGDVTLANFLEVHGLKPELKTETDLYAILIGDVYAACGKLLRDLREAGLNLAVDPTGRKPEKQIKNALKMGIKHALFIGQKELDDQIYALKDLAKNEEHRLKLPEVVEFIRKFNKQNDS